MPTKGERTMPQRIREFDEIYTAILTYLISHPDATLAEVSEKAGFLAGLGRIIPYSTVLKRVSALRQEGVLKRQMKVNLAFLGYGCRYRLDIFIDNRALQEWDAAKSENGRGFGLLQNLAMHIVENIAKGKEFANCLLITDVTIPLWNKPEALSVELLAKSVGAVMDFIQEGLYKTPGISHVVSFQIAWSYTEETEKKEGTDV